MIQLDNRKTALTKLQDLKALNMKGIISHTKKEVWTDDDCQSYWVKDGYFNYVYSNNIPFIQECHLLMNNEYYAFSGTTDTVLNYFASHEIIHWKNTCGQYHYDGEPFDIEALDSLTIQDAEYVNEHYEYKNDRSLAQIKDGIKNKPSSCLRVDGHLVSFVLLHEDDSIGYMYTLPAYRGRGYAFLLTQDIVNKTLKSGRIPYIQIVKGNTKSEQLALKAGFKKHGDVHWFGVIHPKDDFDHHIKRFKTLYDVLPRYLSSTYQLEVAASLDVAVTETAFIFDGQAYPYRWVCEDGVYYVHHEMPEDIFISGMAKRMKKDSLCMTHQVMSSSAFKKLTIE